MYDLIEKLRNWGGGREYVYRYVVYRPRIPPPRKKKKKGFFCLSVIKYAMHDKNEKIFHYHTITTLAYIDTFHDAGTGTGRRT